MKDLIDAIEHVLESEFQRTGKRGLQVKAVDRISDLLEQAKKQASDDGFFDQFGTGYKYDDVIHPCASESDARSSAGAVATITLHKRKVGPWEKIE